MPSREGELPPTGRPSSAERDAIPAAQQQPKRPQKKRVRNFTANDRAAHAVFERSRREAFKDRLLELARLLPTVAETDPSRLSKHVVLEESIARHKTQDTRCLAAAQHIQALAQERDELLAEVNEWRARCGGGFLSPRQAVVNNDSISDLLSSDADQSHARRGQSTSGQSATDAEQDMDLTSMAADNHGAFFESGTIPEPSLQPMDNIMVPQAPPPWTESLDAISTSHEPFDDLAGQVAEPFVDTAGPIQEPSIFSDPEHHSSLPDLTVDLLSHDDLFASPGISDPSSFIPAIGSINHMAPNAEYLYH